MTPSEPSSRQERTIVLISSIGHAICHMGELMFAGVLLAVKDEFHLGVDEAAVLGLLGYILLGLGAIPMGTWADAWGSPRVLHWYFVLMAIASLAVLVSTQVWQLFVSLTTLGLAASIYHPAGLTMISLGVRRRGMAMGINGVVGSLGIALGPALGMLAASHGNWRLAYAVLAGLSLLAALGMVLVRRHLDLPMHSPREAQGGVNVARPGMLVPLALLLSATVLGGFNYRCFATALPGYLSEQQNGGAAVFLVLFFGGIIGQLLGGWAADRFTRRCYPLFITLLTVTAMLLGWLEGFAIAVAVAWFFALVMFAQQPIENLLLAEWSDRRRFSRSYGTKFALTFGIGALGTLATGALWQETGSPGAIFFCVALSAILMLVCAVTALRFLHAPSATVAGSQELTAPVPVSSLVAADAGTSGASA